MAASSPSSSSSASPSLSLGDRIALVVACLVAWLSEFLDLRFSSPIPPKPSFERSIPATISRQKGVIRLVFYTPTSTPTVTQPSEITQPDNIYPAASEASYLRPAVINFHGGGWIFGTPRMDARWAHRITQHGYHFISVDYRLAPNHPYPTPLEDCVDAILWVHAHAEEYGIDRQRIALSGFSAGGNMVFAAAFRLCEELRLRSSKKDLDVGGDMGTNAERTESSLRAIISFYPLVNRTLTDEERYTVDPLARKKEQYIPRPLLNLFAKAYICGSDREHLDLNSPFLSPGLASDGLLRDCLPDKIAMFTCEWDRLRNEGETFRERLLSLGGKKIGGRVIKETIHAWDRLPTFHRGNPKMDEMYEEAVGYLKDFMD
ncbi:uncharacterized protein A1O5_06848 [Cladophialophora psammophila CBS 110553]|uniref:Alpha/beta hydrolase fold-3 domain-containing protein n=1 Tax=Cladophialophora psammophila CBS 110553 TaxID=1182543 RepID=W9WNJ8_9EURO|nr:uncharacterized protein A1O5_06848 [Cladophialophora psammophila CBS 110553]EXJ69777.1 hypothetical protein A1O5_06848 [Cladophialophora psammophila CBS 110553]